VTDFRDKRISKWVVVNSHAAWLARDFLEKKPTVHRQSCLPQPVGENALKLSPVEEDEKARMRSAGWVSTKLRSGPAMKK